MKKTLTATAVAAVTVGFAAEALATEWNVSVWGARRAFTEHVERLAELVADRLLFFQLTLQLVGLGDIPLADHHPDQLAFIVSVDG